MALVDYNKALEVAKDRRSVYEPLNPSSILPSAETETDAPGGLESFAAGFSHENTIINLVKSIDTNKVKREYKDFDVLENLPERYRDLQDEFYRVETSEELDQKVKDLDDYHNRLETAMTNPVAGILGMMAGGLASPTTAIAAIGPIKAYKAAQAAAQAARSGAALTTTAVGIDEILLQATQEGRTAEESAYNMVGAALLGGALGAGIGAMNPAGKAAAQALVRDALAGKATPLKLDSKGFSMDLSAKGAKAYDDVEIAGINDHIAQILSGAKIRGITSPLVRGLTSSSQLVKNLTHNAFDHQISTNLSRAGGVTKAAELDIKFDLAMIGTAARQMDALNKSLRAKGVKLKDPEFQDMVGQAMRRGDQHQYEEVAQAAKYYRSQMEPFVEELQRLDILPQDLEVSTALSYFKRSYNHQKVLAGEGRFIDTHVRHFKKERDEYRSQIGELKSKNKSLETSIKDQDIELNKLKKATDELSLSRKSEDIASVKKNQETIRVKESELKKARFELEEVKNRIKISRLDDEGIDLKARGVYDSVRGFGEKRLQAAEVMDIAFGQTGANRLGKSRTNTVPDEELEEFLDDNAMEAFAGFVANASSAIHSQKMLNRLGYDKFGDLIDDINTQGQLKISNAKTLKAKEKAEKALNQELEDAQMILNVMTGRLGKSGNGRWDTGLQALRTYQMMTMLGGVTLSSLPDMAMPIFKHGVMRAITDGWIGGLNRMSQSAEFKSLNKEALADMGVGVEIETSGLIQSLIDSDFKHGQKLSRTEKLTNKMSKIYGKLTLLSYWNDANKRIAGHVAAARMMRNIQTVMEGGELSKKELNYMAVSRVDRNDYANIYSEFKKYGGEEGGSVITNFNKWNEDARRAFGRSVRSNADSTVLTPGKGDIPAVVQGSEVGKTLFMFKSFMSTATNKIALSGLSRRDAESVQGIVSLLGMGAAVYMIKEKLAGREPDLSVDNLLLQGWVRSGVGGLMLDSALALNPWTDDAARYASGNLWSVLAGPTATFGPNAYRTIINALQAPTDEEVDFNPDLSKRILPLYNIFYLKKTIEMMSKDQEKEDER